MKSDWRDFVISGLCITIIFVSALGLVFLIQPISARAFGHYGILIDAGMVAVSYGLLSAALFRILLAFKPMPEGEHSMDTPAFVYWKLLTVLYRMGQGSLAWCTPFFLKPVLDILFGARIGGRVAFGGTIDDPYMVAVGEGAILGNASLVSGNYLSGGKLVCGRVAIGAWATVGANSVVLPGSSLGEGATLMSGSYLMPGTAVPAGEVWRGNPARKWK